MAYRAAQYTVDIPEGARQDSRVVRMYIQQAIDRCSAEGGGLVRVPGGRSMVGSVRLRSHVTLELDEECALVSPLTPEDFEMEHFEPDSFYRGAYCGIITAFDCKGAALRGGRLIGRGASFWTPMETIGPLWNSTPPRYWANEFRPFSLLFYQCRDLEITGTVIEDSPIYSGWIVDCQDVRFSRARVENNFYGPNTDGFHFSSCVRITVEDCSFQTGDDAIAIDCESGGDSRFASIRNCAFNTSVNALRVYTGLDGIKRPYGRVSSVVMHDCRVTNAAGVINVSAKDGDIRDLEFFNMDIEMRQEGTVFFMMTDHGTIRRVLIRNMEAFSNGVGTIIGAAEGRITDVRVENSRFAVQPKRKLYELDIPDPIPSYAMHHFAPCNLFIRPADRIVLDRVAVTWRDTPEFSQKMYAVVLRDVADASFHQVAVEAYPSGEPMEPFLLESCRDVRTAL